MTRVLILGYTGFIGTHLTNYFAQKEDIQLSVFGRRADVSIPAHVNQIIGDYNDHNAVNNALAGQDIVYHLISKTIPSSSWDDPLNEVNENLIHFIEFLQLAVKQQIKKICFMSSGGTVYGLKENLLNESSVTNPYSPYGIIKNTMENFLQYFKVRNNLNFCIFRLSNVYGEGQDIGKGLGFINTSLENIVLNKPITIFGDGQNVRDYIYVKDAVKILSIGIEEGLDVSNLYNISSGQSITLNELVECFKKLSDLNVTINYLPERPSDIKSVVLDNSKILQSGKNIEFVNLESGIKATFEYIKKHVNQ